MVTLVNSMKTLRSAISDVIWRTVRKLMHYTVVVRVEHEGNKNVIHSTSFLHYSPFEDEIVIDWKEETVNIRKKTL